MNNIPLVIKHCTVNQLEMLYKLISSPERCGYALTPTDGAMVGQLAKLGLIVPKLRTGTKIRWFVPAEVATSENVALINDLLGKKKLESKELNSHAAS